jgi:hypothetical protein
MGSGERLTVDVSRPGQQVDERLQVAALGQRT